MYEGYKLKILLLYKIIAIQRKIYYELIKYDRRQIFIDSVRFVRIDFFLIGKLKLHSCSFELIIFCECRNSLYHTKESPISIF